MKTQYAFHFDSSRCTGCKTCVIACRDKNDIQDPKLAFRTVHEETGGSWSRNEDGSWSQNVWAYFVSVSCNHCSKPACVRVCPTGAHARHEELGGLVLIDRDVCIGCGAVPTRRRSSIARRARCASATCASTVLQGRSFRSASPPARSVRWTSAPSRSSGSATATTA